MSRRKIKTNVHRLFQKTGAQMRYIQRWLTEAGVSTSDESACIRVIKEHQNKSRNGALKKNGEINPNEIDKATGLPWSRALVQEKAISERLDNERKARELSEAFMPTERHFLLLKSLCTKLDQAPAKAKSQLGLNDEQAKGLQKMIDDLRIEFVKENNCCLGGLPAHSLTTKPAFL
jgi:hypothetical protein